MNDNQKDTLTTWLKDAYAMEQGIVEVLEHQLGQMDEIGGTTETGLDNVLNEPNLRSSFGRHAKTL